MHNRTAIRQALETLLSGVTFTLYIEHPDTRLNGVVGPNGILTLGNDVIDDAQQAMGPSWKIQHDQECEIELTAFGADGKSVAEVIDGMELEIEQLLGSDVELGGICEGLYLNGSETEVTFEQDRIQYRRTLQYTIPWRSTFGAPDTPE